MNGIMLTLVLVLLFSSVAYADTYYVATTGSDSNPGTEAQPWASLDYADTQVSPGDTVYVRGGTYRNEWVTLTRSGSPGNLITYKNYPGETPVIDATGLSAPGGYRNGVITISASYIWIEGFEVKENQDWFGIFAWTSATGPTITDITIKDCYVHHNRVSGIQISAWRQSPNPLTNPITNVVIDGCECAFNFDEGSVDGNEDISLLNVDGFEVKNCYVHDNIGYREGIDAKCGCKNGKIHHNEVEDTVVGIYVDGYDRPQSNIDVYNNIVHDNSAGIAFGCERGSNPQLDINFYNNVVYNNNGGFVIWPSTGLIEKTFTLVNNVFYHNSQYQASIGTPAQYQTDCVVRNNIFVVENSGSGLLLYDDYASGGVAIDHNLFYSESGTYPSNTKYGTDYIRSNPLLINPVSDFSIASNSPARDSGSSALAPAFDFVGTARPQGSGYDMGAYEYYSGAPTTTTTTIPGTTTTTTSTTTTTTLPSCDLSSASITSNCAGGSSSYCEEGETISMSGIISGDCSAVDFFQIDADTGCDIQYNNGDMRGIYDATPTIGGSTISGTWTIPAVPLACQGVTVSAVYAGLFDGGPPGTGSWVVGTGSVSGSFRFAVVGGTTTTTTTSTSTTSTTVTTSTTSTTTTTIPGTTTSTSTTSTTTTTPMSCIESNCNGNNCDILGDCAAASDCWADWPVPGICSCSPVDNGNCGTTTTTTSSTTTSSTTTTTGPTTTTTTIPGTTTTTIPGTTTTIPGQYNSLVFQGRVHRNDVAETACDFCTITIKVLDQSGSTQTTANGDFSLTLPVSINPGVHRVYMTIEKGGQQTVIVRAVNV